LNQVFNTPPLTDIPDGTQPVPLGSGVVTRILGHGGMANVYEIWNGQLEVFKAVKLMHPSAGKDSLERFHTEIKICAKLNHPNIVEIHSVGVWHHLPYIEMERLNGVTLDKLLQERGPLPPSVVAAAGICICRGLTFAHNHEYQLYGVNYHGVIHRDLKPCNIMFCNDGQVKIMDFGIARPLDASFHTIDGNVLGTLQYLSPEQMNSGKLDVRTDIYSLGVTLYEALCGHLAFPETNVTALLAQKSKNHYRPLTEYHLDAPSQLVKLINKSMSLDPAHRVADASEFADALAAIGQRLGIGDPQHHILEYMQSGIRRRSVALQKRTPYALITVITVVLAVLAFTTTVLKKKSDTSSTPDTIAADTIATAIAATSPEVSKKDTGVVSGVMEPDKTTADTTHKIIITKKQPVKIVTRQAKVVLQAPVAHPEPIQNTVPTIISPAKKMSLLENLQMDLGIPDQSSVPAALYAAGRYRDLLSVYSDLSSEVTANPKNAVFVLRSYLAQKNTNATGKFLSDHFVNDAEFYLARANLALSRGDIEQAVSSVNAAVSAPKVLLTYDDLNREASYVRALCASKAFDKMPGEETYKDALNKWRDVRAALSSNPSHEYIKVEREERIRMGKVYASVKGQ
jgi:serine/threonine-protein kinase